MRSKVKFLTVFMSIMLALVLVFTAACGNKNKEEETGDYYLSVNGQTYTSKDAAGSYLFSESSGTYSISGISLNAGDTVSANEIGGTSSYGYSSLLSSYFTEGTNAAVATYAGTYAFALDTSFGLAVTSFSPAQTGVKLISTATTMTTGSTFTFTAQLVYSDSTTGSGSVTWSSSDSSVLSIDSSGTATAISAGTATITATSGSFTDSVEVTVEKGADVTVSATSVSLDKTSVSLDLNETATLTATILPENVTSTFLQWSSSNTSVVTLAYDETTDSVNTLTAVGYGSATITVSTLNGCETTCTVSVNKHITEINLDPSSLTVNIDSSRTVSVSFIPSDATLTGYEVEYDSSYIDVTHSGNVITVTGAAETESTTLKVVSTDDSTIYAECSITVQSAGTVNVYLDKSSTSVMIADTAKLTVTAENDTISSVSWTSSSTAKATVSGDTVESGATEATATVTGVAFGTTTITATVTLSSGTTKTATCSVLVADDFFYITGANVGAGDWYSYSSADDASADGVLLEEVSTGVYEITTHLLTSSSFQILFPNTDDNWTNKITGSGYFTSTGSSSYASGSGDSMSVSLAGYYTIRLDLSTSTAKVQIILVSLDITGVTITGDAVLQMESEEAESATAELTLSYEPSAASETITADDLTVSYDSDYEGYDGYVDMSYDFSTLTITLTLNQDPSDIFDVTVHVTLGTFVTSYTVSVEPYGTETKQATAVTFTQDTYYINVNSSWTGSVSASVDDDATVKGVTYSTTDTDYITVDSSTGAITANGFGTFNITATANDGSNVTGTAKVVVYSDTFYLNGVISSQGMSWDNPSAAAPGASLSTAYDNVIFTDVDESHTTFKLTVVLSSSDAFAIVFLGMDTEWTHAIKDTDSYGYETNWSVSSDGQYIITIDLTGTTPNVSIESDTSYVESLTLTLSSGSATLTDDATSATYTFSFSPSTATVTSSDFSYELSNNEGLEVSYNYDNRTITVTRTTAPEENFETTLTITLGNATATAHLTVVASGSSTVAPSGVTFAQDSYSLDMGTNSTWSVTVSASVNNAQEATTTTVTYSITDNTSNATIDSETGVITATFPGTFTVRATADGDDTGNTYAEVKVAFYSTFYIVGDSIDGAGWTLEEGSSISSVDESVVFTDNGDGTYTLVMYATATNAKFRIAYLGNTNWSNLITHDHFSTSGSSDYATWTDTDYNIIVSGKGYYEIVLDITGATPVVTINQTTVVSDISVTFSDGSTSLNVGDTKTLTATVIFSDSTERTDLTVTFNAYSGSPTYYTYDSSTKSVTGVSEGTGKISVSYGTKTVYFEFTVLAAGASETLPTSIDFDETSYSINTNGSDREEWGASSWSVTVSAHVDSSATNAAVKYSTDDSNVSVDSSTGVVTATSLGTFTIKAYAVADESVYTTVTVLVYSDTLFLSGSITTSDGTLNWDSYDSSATSLSGTSFESFAFTTTDNVTYTLTVAPTSTASFKILFLGMDSNWDGDITAEYLDSSSSSYYGSDYNISLSAGSTYTITVSLSGNTPVVSISK